MSAVVTIAKVLWWLVGIALTLQFGYWALAMAGSMFHWCAVPIIAPIWQVSAYVAAFALMLGQVCVELAEFIERRWP